LIKHLGKPKLAKNLLNEAFLVAEVNNFLNIKNEAAKMLDGLK
jgi:hypothetical protein